MTRAAVLSAILVTACGGATTPPTPPKHASSDADLEERVARIEAYISKNAAAIEFLGLVFEQQQKQRAARDDEPAPDAIFAVPVEASIKAGLVDGPSSAFVTIVKAFDFTCPHCMKSSEVLSDLVQEYKGKVRVVFKNLVVHPNAEAAHLASCGAARQGKYLAFKKAFWENGFEPYLQSGGENESSLKTPSLLAIGKSVGLDVKRLEADMASPACRAMLDRDKAELAAFKVTGTPTFFINGTMVVGALPKDGFVAVIDDKLKAAEASGVAGAQYYDREILGKGEKTFRARTAR